MIDENEQESPTKEYATGNVAKIDKLEPKPFTPTATVTTNSITLTGSTTDADATSDNACSGIEKYYFSKDNGTTWEPTDGQTNTSYTFNNLTQKQEYNLKMKAVDKAGKERTTGTVKKTTDKVPTLTTANTIFTYTPNSWTKDNVTVKITTTETGYTLQYKTEKTGQSGEVNDWQCCQLKNLRSI